MDKERTTTKISKKALKAIKIISAYTGESQIEVVDRISEKELVKVTKKDIKP